VTHPATIWDAPAANLYCICDYKNILINPLQLL
jgi:hypothetical protein